jgi:hypothetical protein
VTYTNLQWITAFYVVNHTWASEIGKAPPIAQTIHEAYESCDLPPVFSFLPGVDLTPRRAEETSSLGRNTSSAKPASHIPSNTSSILQSPVNSFLLHHKSFHSDSNSIFWKSQNTYRQCRRHQQWRIKAV